MREVLLGAGVQDAVVEGENIIGNRNGDLIKSTTQKTSRCNILRVDVSKLTQRGQQGVLGTAFGGGGGSTIPVRISRSRAPCSGRSRTTSRPSGHVGAGTWYAIAGLGREGRKTFVLSAGESIQPDRGGGYRRQEA